MADLSMIKRGSFTITHADVGTSKDIALPSTVKTGSSKIRYEVRDRRRNVSVQRGTISITDADAGPTKDSAAFTAVDMTSAEVKLLGFTEKRDPTGDDHGVRIKLQSTTTVRATWGGALGAGETIDLDFEVVEHKARRGATLRLLDEGTLRAEWDLQLVDGETITYEWEVIDFDQLADMILEVDFKTQRILGELGSNQIQDLPVRDDMRNLVGYRVRTFQTKEDAEAATIDIPDGDPLEEGEMHRRKVVVDIDIRTNDRKSLVSLLDRLMDTPGITED
jgi:hypothetical protein